MSRFQNIGLFKTDKKPAIFHRIIQKPSVDFNGPAKQVIIRKPIISSVQNIIQKSREIQLKQIEMISENNLTIFSVNTAYSNKIISYDFFDTLIFRYCGEPHHIFDIIQEILGDEYFSQRRIHAESMSDFPHKFDNIYDKLKELYGYTNETIEQYKKVEIDTEIDNIYPNNELFLKLKTDDIIVSDMYFNENTIRKILIKCVNFNNTFDSISKNIQQVNPYKIKIYVSAGGKSQGWIWNDVNEKSNILYHIGDNYNSDFVMTNRVGVNAKHYIGTPYSDNEKYLINNGNIDLAQLCRCVRLVNPYLPENNPFYGIYNYFANINIPILCLYSKYLSELDGNIVFILRDCYYLKMIYDLLYQKQNSAYLFSSRLVCYNSTDEYIEYFKNVVNEESYIVDLHQTGKSMNTILTKINCNVKLLSITCTDLGYKYENLSYLINDVLGQNIECINSNHLHSLIKLENNIFYKFNNEFSKKNIDSIANCFFILLSFLTQKPIIIRDCNIIESINYLYNSNNVYLRKYIDQIDHSTVNYEKPCVDFDKKVLIPYNNVRTSLITFHTYGFPYDNGYDLVRNAKTFENLYLPFFDNVTIYNTTNCSLLCNNFMDIYLKAYPSLNKGEHARGCNHSFWRWKPFIIQKKLEEINYGEILIYQDCNITRYANYMEYIHEYRNNVNMLFDKINVDVLIPIENPNLLCKSHVKSEVFDVVGENTDYYRNFPLLNANRIFIRKTDTSIQFINEWLGYCIQDNLLFPETNYEPDLKWHTHDQAIASVLYRKYIKQGIFPENSPGFYIANKIFSFENIHQYHC